jgi:hypothetical protein
MMNEWIVVLEVAIEPEGSLRVVDVQRVVQALGDAQAIALSGHDRYALQVHLIDQSCGQALLKAHSRWRSAVRQAGLELSDVVRAEVLAASEFERERQLRA